MNKITISHTKKGVIIERFTNIAGELCFKYWFSAQSWEKLVADHAGEYDFGPADEKHPENLWAVIWNAHHMAGRKITGRKILSSRIVR